LVRLVPLVGPLVGTPAEQLREIFSESPAVNAAILKDGGNLEPIYMNNRAVDVLLLALTELHNPQQSLSYLQAVTDARAHQVFDMS